MQGKGLLWNILLEGSVNGEKGGLHWQVMHSAGLDRLDIITSAIFAIFFQDFIVADPMFKIVIISFRFLFVLY